MSAGLKPAAISLLQSTCRRNILEHTVHPWIPAMTESTKPTFFPNILLKICSTTARTLAVGLPFFVALRLTHDDMHRCTCNTSMYLYNLFIGP
jgi:hypothetical protein